ncbi:MAG: hypothetical protein WD066_00665 [Planctomycetaceae bacterium]
MRTLSAGMLLFAAGCSTFGHDFRAAQNYCPPEHGLEGAWEGTWLSHSNGHDGRLRAVITRCDDRHYHARFHATFLKCVPFESEAILHVTQDGEVIHFQGTEDLGWLAGGVYHYDGSASRREFFADYRADKDHGIFTMRRVSNGDGGCCDIGHH